VNYISKFISSVSFTISFIS